MLVELNIKDFAILENLNVNFTEGFNVLTGETGSGKSIIIEAINLILGGRASKNFIRSGSDKAIVEGIFYLKNADKIKDILYEYGIDYENDNYLILTREIFSTGRSISRVNGRIVTLAMLNRITENIIDIHGQHEHQSLLNPANHIKIIDIFGDSKFKSIKKSIEKDYMKLVSLKKKKEELTVNSMEKEREIDLLKYQIKEIQDADLSVDEEEKLESEYDKISNAKQIFDTIAAIVNILDSYDYDKYSVLDNINESVSLIKRVEKYDDNLKEVAKTLEGINYEIQDISVELKQYMESIYLDEERLIYLENRLDTINSLKKKYGNTIKDILQYEKNIQKRLEKLIDRESEIKRYDSKIKELEKKLDKNSQILSKMRKRLSKKLEKSMENELNQLNMEKAILKVNFERLNHFTRDGYDKIEFLISTNVGESLKPLSEIASGGEISRIMLAFKTILADYDGIPCLIFDEIDTGISGRVAQRIGEKINKISKNRQVICISHLPQVAALADTHFVVNKTVKGNETKTKINCLSYEDRIVELSKLLGGVNLTDTTKLHAKEMLQMSKKIKDN